MVEGGGRCWSMVRSLEDRHNFDLEQGYLGYPLVTLDQVNFR
jgi:hypothetical protein